MPRRFARAVSKAWGDAEAGCRLRLVRRERLLRSSAWFARVAQLFGRRVSLRGSEQLGSSTESDLGIYLQLHHACFQGRHALAVDDEGNQPWRDAEHPRMNQVIVGCAAAMPSLVDPGIRTSALAAQLREPAKTLR